MNFRTLSEKVKFPKETEEGNSKVCRAMEKIIDDDRIDTAKALIMLGKLSYEEIAQSAKIPIDLVEELVSELKESK